MRFDCVELFVAFSKTVSFCWFSFLLIIIIITTNKYIDACRQAVRSRVERLDFARVCFLGSAGARRNAASQRSIIRRGNVLCPWLLAPQAAAQVAACWRALPGNAACLCFGCCLRLYAHCIFFGTSTPQIGRQHLCCDWHFHVAVYITLHDFHLRKAQMAPSHVHACGVEGILTGDILDSSVHVEWKW